MSFSLALSLTNSPDHVRTDRLASALKRKGRLPRVCSVGIFIGHAAAAVVFK